MSETVMLTVFLKHDQSKNLEQIQSHLAEQDWWRGFPPEGAEILSWNVVMGIGQVVTLRMAPEILPKVNVELERRAWGVFSTEFFPTYDFVPVRERLTREAEAAKAATATAQE
ncbi:hypothetical protein [Pseudooceanicola algae]|uniref:DUF3303 domain-containing protein n=1 Tax=Pseudooceanicola algae TaxID=1537215 RepID=A0A418SK01_9RHOB|nr:hypothetical protein [Pseudooceanicola algae]QPM92216.1 hypothetical protein PSAL_034800 [Pseudooceanicola algae]